MPLAWVGHDWPMWLARTIPNAAVLLDAEGRVLCWNLAAERLFGYSAQEAEGRAFYSWLFPADDGAGEVPQDSEWAGCEPVPVWHITRELRATHRQGHPLIVELSLTGFFQDGHRHTLGILRDLTEFKQMAALLEHTQAGFTNLVVKNRSGILVVDQSGRICFANPSAQVSLGRDESRLKGLLFGYPNIGSHTEMDIVRPDGGYGVAEVTATETEWEGRRAFLVMLHDITERKRAEDTIRYQAEHDLLTGLANRHLFMEHLVRAIHRASRGAQRFALLFLDLDRFKTVNDTLGHSIGDELLKAVARRIERCLRASDVIARMSGDEFCILAEDIHEVEDAAGLARKVIAQFDRPFDLGAHQRLYTRPSIGIALYPSDGDCTEILLRNADTAMYAAKRAADGGFAFYRPDQTRHIAKRFDLETRLRAALDKQQLRLHYQPQIRLGDHALSGCEALLRWRQTDGRLTAPSEFMPLLEETGLIVPVSAWVLRTASAQTLDWRRQGLTPPPVVVNLSAIQLDNDQLPDDIERLLASQELPPHCFGLDVTERAVLRNPSRAAAILTRLADLGVRLHMDDFGTGYASLSLLGSLPFHSLKIDRECVSSLIGSDKQVELIDAMVAMAHRLRMEVVAEGVETPEQLALLRDLGCDHAQGFLLGKPLTPGFFTRRLRAAAQALPPSLREG